MYSIPSKTKEKVVGNPSNVLKNEPEARVLLRAGSIYGDYYLLTLSLSLLLTVDFLFPLARQAAPLHSGDSRIAPTPDLTDSTACIPLMRFFWLPNGPFVHFCGL